MQRESARFLNLDLELNAPVNLAPLRKHLEGTAYVLFQGRVDGAFRLCAEPLIRGNLGKSPRTCTAHFLRVLENLPPSLARLLERCSSRIFDYGFDGGFEAKPLSVTLAPAQLAHMAALGIGLRVTVYPHRPENRAQ